jgi:hypothetical protein
VSASKWSDPEAICRITSPPVPKTTSAGIVWDLHVCVCVCYSGVDACVHARVYTRVYTCVCAHTRVYTCMYACFYACVYAVHMRVCMHVYAVHMRVYMGMSLDRCETNGYMQHVHRRQMYVCMCVWCMLKRQTHVYVCICMCANACICMYMYVYVCVCMCMLMVWALHANVCMCMCVCAHAMDLAGKPACVHVCVYMLYAHATCVRKPARDFTRYVVNSYIHTHACPCIHTLANCTSKNTHTCEHKTPRVWLKTRGGEPQVPASAYTHIDTNMFKSHVHVGIIAPTHT